MELAPIGREHFHNCRFNLHCGKVGALEQNKRYKEAFRVILVSEGSGVIKIDDSRYVFAAPVVFCFNEEDPFEFEIHSKCRAQAVWFHSDIINSSFDHLRIRKDEHKLTYTEAQDIFGVTPFCRRKECYTGQLSISPGTAKRVMELLNSIEYQVNHQPDGYWPSRSRSYLIELLFLITIIRDRPHSMRHISLHRYNVEINDVIRYLHSNYSEKITLAELTREFHINRTTLGRDFSEATGCTIMAYLQKLRLYLASQLLKNTTLPIAEVYDRIGYNDPAHFVRQFKKRYGVTPSKYRQQNSWIS